MIKIKTAADIKAYQDGAGLISKQVLRYVGTLVKPGVTTFDLDKAAEKFIREHDAIPGFKGHEGFPGTICASVNEEVVHGIPSPNKVLEDGDIISIDTGANKDGWAGDNAWTFFCGTVTEDMKGLCECTRDCLKAGIEQAVPGNRIGDIGHAIQKLAESNGYGVVRDYTGHGIGHDMWEDPAVPNYGRRHWGVKLQPGMFIAIEPMITMGTKRVHTLNNGWTVVTDDGKPAAHYENAVAITADGPVILSADEIGPWCALQGGEAYAAEEEPASEDAPAEEEAAADEQ